MGQANRNITDAFKKTIFIHLFYIEVPIRLSYTSPVRQLYQVLLLVSHIPSSYLPFTAVKLV